MSTRVVFAGSPRLVLTSVDLPRVEDHDVERRVEAQWLAARARRPELFDAPLLSATLLKGGELGVRFVPYRWFIAQREDPTLARALGVAPVGVSGLVVAQDGGVLLGRRGPRVTQYPGWWEAVPSGSLDSRALGGATASVGLTLTPAAALEAELSEEAGLEDAVRSSSAVALLLDEDEQTYDVAYLIRVSLDSVALREKVSGARSDEYSEMAVVARQELAAVMARGDLVSATRTLVDVVLHGDTRGCLE